MRGRTDALYTAGNSAHGDIVASGTAGRAGNPAAGGSGINMFTDPQAIYQSFRPMILGVDGRFGGFLRGFPGWNLDMAVRKTMRFKESMGATLSFEFINVLNRFQPGNPSLNVFDAASWGVVNRPGQRTAQNRIWTENFLLMTADPTQVSSAASASLWGRLQPARLSAASGLLLLALTCQAQDLFTENSTRSSKKPSAGSATTTTA